MNLILATKNRNKVAELENMFQGTDIHIQSLFDFPEIEDIIEDGATFEENALIKARTVVNKTGLWVLADDSGLVVDALDGAPGIFSSRYSGREKDYNANNEKLLHDMQNIPNEKRSAYFICVMALCGPNGEEYIVEGRCEGQIFEKGQGKQGFGYDPIFYVPSKCKTMAELDMEEKNRISHRGRALEKIKDLLLDLLSKD